MTKKLSKKKRIRKKQIKVLNEKGIVVGQAYNFLFDAQNERFNDEYKGYI